MRFTAAWASVSSQNSVLRLVVTTLVGLLILMTVVAARAMTRDPLIIERSCFSSVLSPKLLTATPVEFEAFIKEALHERFDSDATLNADYLSLDEYRGRGQEQQELAERQMKQRVILNSLAKEGETVTVDTDRIISVGQVRSAFSFPLVLTVSSVSRSEANPYGLVLVKISQPKLENIHEKQD